MTTLNLTVPDMACGACVETITKAVQALDSTATVEADTKTKALTVTTSMSLEVISQAIADAGYTVNG